MQQTDIEAGIPLANSTEEGEERDVQGEGLLEE